VTGRCTGIAGLPDLMRSQSCTSFVTTVGGHTPLILAACLRFGRGCHGYCVLVEMSEGRLLSCNAVRRIVQLCITSLALACMVTLRPPKTALTVWLGLELCRGKGGMDDLISVSQDLQHVLDLKSRRSPTYFAWTTSIAHSYVGRVHGSVICDTAGMHQNNDNARIYLLLGMHR